ncbi:cadherin-related family member 5 isoform X2 [Ascaphus truei]|uniref:cadherin-related family member 5 isoform X2 n=1 Tax=Ascaphus truei TaxID=8439 RepID=UPI003F5A40E1
MGSTLALYVLLLILVGCAAQGPVCTVANTRPEVAENNPVGHTVTTIVTDPDVTMSISGGAQASFFSIVGSNLTLTQSVDFEVTSTLSVQLECKRDGAIISVIHLYVTILNENDNEPIFSQTSFNFTIPEDLKVGSSIGTAITADDADKDTIFYELSGTDLVAAAHFKLATVNNPIIQVNQSLDYDTYKHIQLILTARDTENAGDIKSHTATATVNIEIWDVDDKPPQFLPCRMVGTKICINDGYRGNVTRSEHATGALILTPAPLYAVDGDVGINDPIDYEIVSGNVGDIFDVNGTTGNITMKRAADNLEIIILQVMAVQASDVGKYTMTRVQIEVKERNNHPPVFESGNYLGEVPARSAIRSFVTESRNQGRPLQVFAADEDFTDKVNPGIVYSIENSSDFSISRDGFILTNAVFPSPITIEFSVAAMDSATGEVSRTLVTVDVTPGVATTMTVSTTTGTGTTQSTTTGTGTTQSTTPGTGTTQSTTTGTGTTQRTTPGTGTIKSTTPGTGTTKSTTPGSGATPGTITIKSTTPGTGTTTSTTPGTGTTKSISPGTGTTKSTTQGTGAVTTISKATTSPGTGSTTSKAPGISSSPGPGFPITIPLTTTDNPAGTTHRPTGSSISTAWQPSVTGTDSSTESTTKSSTGSGVQSDKLYSAGDMAALGASLGVILALCLAVLGFLIYRHYGHSITRKLGKGSGDGFGGTNDGIQQLIEEETGNNPDPDISSKPSTNLGVDGFNSVSGESLTSTVLVSGAAVTSIFPLSETAEESSDPEDKKEVKSILTKEFKDDPGYKAVWFMDHAQPEVVVINGAEEGELDDEVEEEYNTQEDDDEEEDDEEPEPRFQTNRIGSNDSTIL